MSRYILREHPCPVCGTMIGGVMVKEEAIKEAPRVPVLVLAMCKNEHLVILFVDRNLDIREAEPVLDESRQQST
ncbi:MAG: hypothetical protein ACFFDP_12970 [Promethearchaeota archaeon]